MLNLGAESQVTTAQQGISKATARTDSEIQPGLF